MLGVALLVFREVLEAALIVSIVPVLSGVSAVRSFHSALGRW